MENSLRWLVVALLVCTMTACLASSVRLSKQVESIPLFILAGQSNMHGQAGDAAAYPGDPLQLDPTIPFYWAIPHTEVMARLRPNALRRSKGWVGLGPQSGLFPAGHFGPEISFARKLTQFRGSPVAVFKFSLGGAGLARDWKRPGEQGLYDQFCEEYHRAIKQMREQGQEPEPQAFVWIQGEEDSLKPEWTSQYPARLELLIQDFRENQLGQPDLPVMLGLDEQYPSVSDNPQVIEAQEAIAATDPNIIRTSMVGLEKADFTHLTPAGLVEHGDRLAAAWLELRQAQ